MRLSVLAFWLVTQAYTESVPQDLPVGREVMRVSAADIDDGNNSVVRYSLQSKRSDDAVYFRIDPESGVIFLNKAIDVSNAKMGRVLREYCSTRTSFYNVTLKLELVTLDSLSGDSSIILLNRCSNIHRRTLLRKCVLSLFGKTIFSKRFKRE